MAEIVEVSTTRFSPSAAAASTATTGACAFIRHTSSAGFEPTKPTVWKSTSAPFIARRMALKSSTSALARRTLTPARCLSRSALRYVTRTSSPRSASRRVTWPPRKPVAPVTTAFMRVSLPRSAQKQPEDRLGAPGVGPLAQDQVQVGVGLDHAHDHVRDLAPVGLQLDLLGLEQPVDPVDQPGLEAAVRAREQPHRQLALVR